MRLAIKCNSIILIYKGGLKRAYDDVISAIDQWNPSTEVTMEEMWGPQEGLCWKMNFGYTPSKYLGLVWFGLVVFYGITTLMGYLMPDPVNTCMICKWIVCQ